MPTATPIRMPDETPDRPALCLAFAWGAHQWQRGCTTGAAPRPRERHVPARPREAVRDESRQAKARGGLPADAPVLRGDEAGRDGCWLPRWLGPQGGPTAWSTRPAWQSSAVTGGRRPIGSMGSRYAPGSAATPWGHGRWGGSSGSPGGRQQSAVSGRAPARPRTGLGRASSTAAPGGAPRTAWGGPPAGTSRRRWRTSAWGTAPRSRQASPTVAGRRRSRGWR
jgi:hypothetical protein